VVKLKNGAIRIAHTYAVTNAHAAPQGASVIRLIMADGSARVIDLEPHEWEVAPGGPDLAIFDVTDEFAEGDDYTAINEEVFVTQQFIEDALINIGEDGFMLGLFADEPGQDRNAPVGRFGNIAAMPSGTRLIKQPNGSRQPSFVFDIHSRSGFSGSPVFVFRTATFDMQKLIRSQGSPYKAKKYPHPFVRLLGVHCAQYHDLVAFEVVGSKSSEKIALDGYWRICLPNSMTIVIPAWEITNMIDLKKFANKRAKRESRAISEFSKRSMVVVPEVAQGDGSNPAHKEDFMRLLGAAAKAKPQADRT
jgi:hypothetical protein